MNNSFHNLLIPVVETERLILRAYKPEDFPTFASMRADPVVAKYLTGKPIPEAQAWTKFLSFQGLWQMLGFGYWAIEEKATGDFIGDVGFADFKRDMTPSLKGIPEIGWALDAAYHGKGYGSEAVAAVVAWGDKTFTDPRTVCIIDLDNPASLRLAEKNGYNEFTRTKFEELNIIVFERLPSAPPITKGLK